MNFKKYFQGPKEGKIDPKNLPHVGGNTWKGGSGGTDTPGLGGKMGPYRSDSGNPVNQISEAEKKQVTAEMLKKAREAAEVRKNLGMGYF